MARWPAKEHGDLLKPAQERMSAYCKKVLPPSLKYTGYCIINEIEAQCTSAAFFLSENGELQRQNMRPRL